VNVTAQVRAQQEATAYGRGWLVDDGDIVLVTGQVEEIVGTANLVQGLLLRIATPWGSDRLNTTYGLDATDVFTTGLTRDLTKEVLRLNLIRTLSGDPRVSTVDQVLFDDDPQYLADHPESAGTSNRRVALAEITVTPIAPGPTTASLPISAAALATATAGDTQSLGAVTLLADVRW
jgi:hypothetical protein